MNRSTAEPRVEQIPGEHAQRLIDRQGGFAATSTKSYGFVWDYTAEAVGPFCTDLDGNVLLDFTSQIGAAPLGYNHPTLHAKLAEFDLPTPTKVAGQNFYSGARANPDVPGPADLMDRLSSLTAEYALDTVFLSNSGAEAVENGIKIACHHAEGASQGIAFRGAFHGRTLGALSLNRSKAVHRHHYPQLPGIYDVPFCTDRACSRSGCPCGFFPGDGDTSLLAEMLDPGRGYIDPDDLAYIIVEPIQGEGGYRFPSDAFAAEVQAVCDRHEILLIADEIQTGLGRTGTWWGSDHYAFEPDIILAAKALQVGATVSRRDVFPAEQARISSTWGGGDVLGAMQGVLTLDVIEEEDLLGNARKRGEHLKRRLRSATPTGVSNVRGKGLMVALDFASDDLRQATVQAALERGLLTLTCGNRSLRLIPPLDVTEREIDLGADIFLEAIEAASATAGSDVA